MGLRNAGGYISASYNPLAANVGPGVQTNQTEGVFTLQTAMQAVAADQWCTDPNFKQTTLLLQADNAANASQNNTFLDSSTNNFTITRSGNTTQGSLSPFSSQPGYWSGYFGGTGYYATTPFQSLPTTTSTFTIEAWIFQTAYPVAQGGPVQPSLVGDQNPTGAGANWMFGVLSTGLLSFWWNDTGTKACVGNTVTPLNTWIHVAVSVSANAIKLFVGGVLQTLTGTTTLANRGTDQGRTTIGQYANANSYIFGYVSNLRIVTGTALYSTSFTPSTTPLTAISGTTLLTLQNNTTFRDASTNDRTITPTLAAGQPFSPARPQYSYTPTVTGGSGYVDGAGDYLSLPSSANLAPGSVFTFELWIYIPAIVTDMSIYAASTNSEFQCGFNGSGAWGIATRGVAWQLTSTTLPRLNQWNHIVVSRGGTGANQTSLFLNGVRVANGTVSAAYSGTSAYQIGANGLGAGVWKGYISNLRLVKSDVYGYTNTTITVPTEPQTAIANTALLLNFTNAGITDASLKNAVETAGNAQVSTAIKKYGSGSMLFDGTGDYLYVASSDNFELGAGDFTIEFWMYPTTIAGAERGVFGIGTTDPDSNLVRIQQSTSKLQFWIGGSNSAGPGAGTKTGIITCTTTIAINTWYHVALVRSGAAANNVKLYLNGVVDGQGSATYNIGAKPFGLGMGYPNSAIELYIGYIDDFRITKGIARYTAAFTPRKIAFARQ